MYIKLKHLSVVLVASIPLTVAAAPEITALEVSSSDGSEIRVFGAGFGSPSFGIILRDSADSNTLISDLGSESRLPQSEVWTSKGSLWADPLTLYTGSDLQRGEDRNVYRGVRKAYMGWPEPLTDRTNKTLFVSWWFMPLSDPNAEGGSNKFLRVWDHPDGEHTRMAWDQTHVVYWRKDVDSAGFIQWGGWQGKVGAWNKIDAWFDANSNKMIIHVNGKKVIDVDDFKKSSVSPGLNVDVIGLDPSVGDNYANMVFGVDDIYISESQARVEISNSEIWKEGIVSEIATPTSWTDNELSFNLDPKVVSFGAPIYVYVFDPQGNVNTSGIPLSSKAPSKIEDIEVK